MKDNLNKKQRKRKRRILHIVYKNKCSCFLSNSAMVKFINYTCGD